MPLEYKGDRSKEDIVRFIKDNTPSLVFDVVAESANDTLISTADRKVNVEGFTKKGRFSGLIFIGKRCS